MIEVKELTIREQEDLNFSTQEDIDNGTIWSRNATRPVIARCKCYEIKDAAYWNAFVLFDPIKCRTLAIYSQVITSRQATVILKKHLNLN